MKHYTSSLVNLCYLFVDDLNTSFRYCILNLSKSLNDL